MRTENPKVPGATGHEPADRNERRLMIAACGIWAILAVPHVRTGLEGSMALHMLLQIPLLAAVGVLLHAALRRRVRSARGYACWSAAMRGGAAGLLFAAFVLTWWMLPRALDAALLDARHELAKFVLVPAAGAAIAAAWPRCPALGRLVVHVEVIATLLRFGWGYLEAPDRLCVVYLLDEQRVVGTALLALGGLYAIAASWRVMFGEPPWRRVMPRAGRRPWMGPTADA